MPQLSVVIPTLNEAGTLPRLLDALRAQTRPPDEIIARRLRRLIPRRGVPLRDALAKLQTGPLKESIRLLKFPEPRERSGDGEATEGETKTT